MSRTAFPSGTISAEDKRKKEPLQIPSLPHGVPFLMVPGPKVAAHARPTHTIPGTGVAAGTRFLLWSPICSLANIHLGTGAAASSH
jgi:hypothetical protein